MQSLSKLLLVPPTTPDPLLDQIRRSGGTEKVLAFLRRTVPDVTAIPQTTYWLYREFERSGQRDSYQRPYYAKRSQLARAVLEMIVANDDAMAPAVSDLLWSICEETSWVLPAHEEQGPAFWELKERSPSILVCNFINPSRRASGRGGQPGTYTSTGITLSTPPEIL